ncbi:MAG: ATP-binding cassette domain-containing protein [Polyangiaceae bacterium]
MIEVEGLRKTYAVPVRGAGLGSAVRSLFRRQVETVVAVDGISFRIARGERVGFLGPNGAGKTTTLKILAGLLHPTAGRVEVAGHVPARRDDAYLRRIMLVLGQKQQLIWDLPPADTFELNRAVYDIERDAFEKRLAELTEILGLGDHVKKPTRQLSLGERMKCELVAALLHAPDVLFLDEPTIGLDVTAQADLRSFINRYCAEHGATLLLTSHYMEDVAAMCPRVLVIDKGSLVADEPLDTLTHRARPQKRLVLRLERPRGDVDLGPHVQVVSESAGELVLDVPRAEVSHAAERALRLLAVADLTIKDPPLEDVMRELFQKHKEPS